MNNWKAILISAGIDQDLLTGNHCPCPKCEDGKDRFRFDNYKGNGEWICSHCGSGNGFDLLKHICGTDDFKEVLAFAREHGYDDIKNFSRPMYDLEYEDQSKIKKAKEKLKANLLSMEPAKGTVAELYLKRRKIELIEPWKYKEAEVAPFFIPNDEYWHEDGTSENLPAVAWKVWRGDGKKYGIHKTYLADDGTKAPVGRPKKITQRTLPKLKMNEGGYLYAPLRKGNNNIVILGEGIETTLSAWHIMNDIHGENCYAISLLNRMGLSWFVPHSDKFNYLIFADNDESKDGQFAAVDLLRRTYEKFNIKIIMPPDQRDWNDIWIRGDKTELHELPFKNWL